MSDIIQLATRAGELLLQHKLVATTAESCTGGGIAYAITEIAGSSSWFDRSFVTYSNTAKEAMLGVPAALLAQYGAVSEQVARAMAEGAIAHSQAQVALSTTGIAGPSGAVPGKPVGTVCFGWVVGQQVITETRHFDGDRQQVRLQSITHSLTRLISLLQ